MPKFSILLSLALLLAPSMAFADPPAPKVCVVVAGDPDTVVQTLAESLVTGIASRSADLRGVADADTRAVLEGTARPEPSLQWLSSSRRTLTGHESDAGTLDTMADGLGCALAIEVAARPAGLSVRVYDVVQHRLGSLLEAPSIDVAAMLDRTVIPAARVSTAAARVAASSTPPPAPGSSIAPVAVPWSTSSSSPTVASSSSPPPDPRVTVQPEHSGRTSVTGIVGWVIAGAAAATLIAGFFIVQSTGSQGPPVITVHHGSSQ